MLLRTTNRRRQGGAVIITMALLLLFLLGFMGFALDFSRLFIVKTELQTAMDSCALSAAQELDRPTNAITRARSAGITAANLNRVNLQSATWDGKGQVTAAEITFFNSGMHADDQRHRSRLRGVHPPQPDVRLWLMRAMTAFSGNGVFPATQNVGARAIAKRGSAQTACPIPVAVKAGAGAPPMYGLVAGQWVKVWGDKSPGSGEFGWYNLDGSKNAKATRDQLEAGVCNTRVGDTLGTPGAKTAVDTVWNYRFGIYKNNVDHALHRPDYSGYAYRARVPFPGETAGNWTSLNPLTLSDGTTTTKCCAWNGTRDPSQSDGTAQNFVTQRGSYASFGMTVKIGSQIVYGNQNQLNGFQVVATSGANGEHARFGAPDRRIATVPVLDGANRVIDYLCVFMLHPMSGPNDDVRMEIVGACGRPSKPLHHQRPPGRCGRPAGAGAGALRRQPCTVQHNEGWPWWSSRSCFRSFWS